MPSIAGCLLSKIIVYPVKDSQTTLQLQFGLSLAWICWGWGRSRNYCYLSQIKWVEVESTGPWLGNIAYHHLPSWWCGWWGWTVQKDRFKWTPFSLNQQGLVLRLAIFYLLFSAFFQHRRFGTMRFRNHFYEFLIFIMFV